MEEIASELVSDSLEDMSDHLLPRRKHWSRHGCTWSMRRGNKVVRSQTDFLLGMDLRLNQNISV